MRIDEGARRQTLQRCGQVREHDAVREQRYPGERAQPLRDDVRVRREAVVGQRLVVGECEHRQVVRYEELELGLEPLELRGILRENSKRTFGSDGGLGERQRQRRAPEPLPTSTRL